MKIQSPAGLVSALFTAAVFIAGAAAQTQAAPPPATQPAPAPATQSAPAPATQPAQPQPPPTQAPSLWIAKFTCQPDAASAVASTQMSVDNALNYSSLFSAIASFDTTPQQPAGTWSLTANEVEYKAGSAAERTLVGLGAGRASITMEYKLTNDANQVVWTQQIKTEPSFWGASGAQGAVQNQGAAVDEQAQKLTQALTKYFNPSAPKEKKKK